MSDAFTSWGDFFAMGGYALYVWPAVVCTVIPLAALILHTCRQHWILLRTLCMQPEKKVVCGSNGLKEDR